MRELHCVACGCANGVPGRLALDDTRCAECQAPLDAHRPVRYHVSDRGVRRGPEVLQDLTAQVAGRTLTPDTLIAEEHGPWFRAGEREDLFPSASAPIRRAPAGVSRAAPRTPRPPGAVRTMVVLAVLAGAFLFVLGFVVFAFAASAGARTQGLGAVLLFWLLGGAHIAIANHLWKRSVAARNAQLFLAALGGLGVLALGAEGLPASFALVGGLLVALPFLLLLSAESRVWFAGDDPAPGP